MSDHLLYRSLIDVPISAWCKLYTIGGHPELRIRVTSFNMGFVALCSAGYVIIVQMFGDSYPIGRG